MKLRKYALTTAVDVFLLDVGIMGFLQLEEEKFTNCYLVTVLDSSSQDKESE